MIGFLIIVPIFVFAHAYDLSTTGREYAGAGWAIVAVFAGIGVYRVFDWYHEWTTRHDRVRFCTQCHRVLTP